MLMSNRYPPLTVYLPFSPRGASTLTIESLPQLASDNSPPPLYFLKSAMVIVSPTGSVPKRKEYLSFSCPSWLVFSSSLFDQYESPGDQFLQLLPPHIWVYCSSVRSIVRLVKYPLYGLFACLSSSSVQ